MIHFRYHLVSLIAVFLALAIGVAMGATVINSAVVDALRSQVSSAERRADNVKRENDQLKNDRAQASAFVNAVADDLVSGRLTGQRVQFVVADGLDGDAVDDLVKSVSTAGGTVSSILWLTEDSTSNAGRTALRSIVGGTDPKRLWSAVVDELTAAEVAPSETSQQSDPTTSTAAAATGVIDQLVTAGVFRRSEVPAASGTGPVDVVVFLDGPASKVTGESSVANAAKYATKTDLITVVGELWATQSNDETAQVGGTLAAIRNDERLRKRIATVDSLDRPEVRALLVLVTEAAIGGRIGQYGYGLGARDGVVPEHA
ncbi:MAG: copper transporter [Acidimicrobiia bacterium]